MSTSRIIDPDDPRHALYLAPAVEPGPGYRCDGPFPYHQPVNERDIDGFLRHTEGLQGHTFTERGRS